MGEATRAKRSSTTESKKDTQKTQGWIRIHSDENEKTTSLDEPEDSAAQLHDRKVRKLEKSIE